MIDRANVTNAKCGYIRALDGWRAIAVWAVIFHHSRVSWIEPLDVRPLSEFCDHGVHLFFAISGILICLRLLEEGALHGGFQPRLPYKRPGSGSVW